MKKFWIIALIVVAIAVIGYYGYKAWEKKKNSGTNSTPIGDNSNGMVDTSGSDSSDNSEAVQQ